VKYRFIFIYKAALSVLFCVLFTEPAGTQTPDIDQELKKQMLQEKARHYSGLAQSELQKTENQDDFDIIYYDLRLNLDPDNQRLEGIVTIEGKVTATSLSFIELNFWAGMNISRIYTGSLPGSDLTFSRANELISVQLGRSYLQNEVFSIVVEYNGHPQNSPYYSFSFDSHQGQPMIWTLSSVFGARAWWPCKDVPSDKPDSMDIRITVPDNQYAVSNGLLREITSEAFTKTYWWHESYPVATYLVFLAVYPYELNSQDYLYNNGSDTMKINFYSFPGNYQRYLELNNKVKEMLILFSDLFGEYPFVKEKYGQADFLWSGGMEHQTCTTYGRWTEPLFAHEIAHQWWGDLITCDSFHHIWLNEGLASYSEAFWYEHLYPGYTASEYQMDYQLYLGPGTIYVEDPYNQNIFDLGLSYYKGSWVVHMLRHITGDETLFNIFRTYYSSPAHQYGSATTAEFRAICEEVSGLNLEKFFQQWIYEEYYPNYDYTWNWQKHGAVYDIQLNLEQLQSNHLFWMPVDVTVTTALGETTLVVWDSLAHQSFELTVNSEPQDLEIDKYNWILKIVEESFSDPVFDQGVLLVNGVFFETYDEEIRNAYENKAFWGNLNISFWDCFDTPEGGYPPTLPQPLGHGKIPSDILGNYSTVIWIGNNYAGDLGKWQLSPIHDYLEAGGNVLLTSRNGQGFIYGELQDYLGINWAENTVNWLNNCEAVYPGLQSMEFIGEQSSNAVFDTDLESGQSVLLFKESESFSEPRGLGVWHKPDQDDESETGGNFVFISGRPYRYNQNQLRQNIEYIVNNLFTEPGGKISNSISLLKNYPNPFTQSTRISYSLPVDGMVTIDLFNILGQKSLRLFIGFQTANYYVRNWETEGLQHRLSSGVYLLRISLKGEDGKTYRKSTKMLYLK